MTEETAPAATSAPAEQTTTEPKTDISPAAGVPTDAAPEETAETKPVEGSAPSEDDQPKKLTRNQRLQRKAARLATLVAEQQAKIAELEKRSASDDAPKEADYNGDYTAYQTDLAAYKAAQKIGSKLDEQAKAQASDKIREAKAEAAEDFLERANELKAKIPDFDETFEKFATSGGKFSEHVIEELHDSDKGPQLAYHIAKNPQLAATLNQMSPRDVAREIGRLEATVSLPQPRKQTQAPPPITPPSGGATPGKDIHALAKSNDMAAYIKARNAEEQAKQR